MGYCGTELYMKSIEMKFETRFCNPIYWSVIYTMTYEIRMLVLFQDSYNTKEWLALGMVLS
jgi:hypothetical protein